MIRRVTVEKLAPTGEGIVRGAEGVGFVEGALPGEQVEACVHEVRRRFWKGRTVSLLLASAERRAGPHADCAACDWAHFDAEAARREKRRLFGETMERIGELPAKLFGELPILPSPPGYRLRARLHVTGRGGQTALGYYAPRTHRVEPAEKCEALPEAVRALLPPLREAIAESGADVSSVAMVGALDGTPRIARILTGDGTSEDRRGAHALSSALAGLLEGVAVEGQHGELLASRGERRLWLCVGGRQLPVTARTFFQSNRFLIEDLYRDVLREAAAVPPGQALDAFSGVGLFAGALLDAGHRVVSVEADGHAVEQALEAKKRWQAQAWQVMRSGVLPFVRSASQPFDLAVADPPRAGLGLELAGALADCVRSRIVYVSCEPATLARDLAVMVARGYRIVGTRLYDLFAFTHRVEAVVVLSRA
ncbi:MAG: class I SAM-dependent RNA methyltransferase [Thermoanaerobaculia bacterium]